MASIPTITIVSVNIGQGREVSVPRIIDAELLCVALANNPSFIFDTITFAVPLDVVDPH